MEIGAKVWEAVAHQWHVQDGALYKFTFLLLLYIW